MSIVRDWGPAMGGPGGQDLAWGLGGGQRGVCGPRMHRQYGSVRWVSRDVHAFTALIHSSVQNRTLAK